jgi:hypothetical protein
MSFDNFITLAVGLLVCGTLLGIFLRKLWGNIKRSRLYYLVTPKLIKPYVGEK